MDSTAYEALRQRAAYINLSGRGKLRAVGDDRSRLLHAMCTNNIQTLIPGTGCYAFFLTAQGRILADANIFCMPDYLLIDTDPEIKPKLQEHLEKYIIADDVTLTDFTTATATINVEGAQADSVLESLGCPVPHIPFALVEWGRKMAAHTNYTGAPGYSVFVPVEELPSFLDQLTSVGLPEADHETVELVRIENGHPRFGIDFGENNIPQETPLMQAVHFSKGCYLGQEIVERVRSRGHVNRVLTPIELESGEAPAQGSKVTSSSGDVGEITSAAFSPMKHKVAGLAMLRTEALRSGASLSVGGHTLKVATHPVP